TTPLTLGADEDFTPLPAYKSAGTTDTDFSGLLSRPLRLHEDLTNGCGGRLWPAGMVLARHMLRYHRDELRQARILELGAGGGLVGLAVASGCALENPLYITDQAGMLDLMAKNTELNGLTGKVKPALLNWGEPLPPDVAAHAPDVVLAADCVYFEPAFPLLLATLRELLARRPAATVYFCFKKRRRADAHFFKAARKAFAVAEIDYDDERPVYSRDSVFLYTFRSKTADGGGGDGGPPAADSDANGAK
ncbi:putative methyltransferase-domain-containing protein, partial [Xylariomycetidae sp. FL0641]